MRLLPKRSKGAYRLFVLVGVASFLFVPIVGVPVLAFCMVAAFFTMPTAESKAKEDAERLASAIVEAQAKKEAPSA